MWFDAFPLVEFAINSAINISTGFTPFYMLYGAQVALPIDHALLDPPMSVATSYVAAMRKIVQDAHAAMAKAQQA